MENGYRSPKLELQLQPNSAALVSIFDDLHRAGRLSLCLAKSAIVSPIARPKARIVAATIPGAAVGRSTRKIVSHRVAPTA